VLPSWHKLTFGLLATITLQVVPFRAYSPFPAFLPSFKCILEVVFCEGVQYRLRFNSIVSKWRPFSFIFNRRNQRKAEWTENDGHVVFGQKFPGEKESETVRFRDITASF
jgi:hypothetical protein